MHSAGKVAQHAVQCSHQDTADVHAVCIAMRLRRLTAGSGRINAILALYAASSGRNFVFRPNGVLSTISLSILSGFAMAHNMAYWLRTKP